MSTVNMTSETELFEIAARRLDVLRQALARFTADLQHGASQHATYVKLYWLRREVSFITQLFGQGEARLVDQRALEHIYGTGKS